MKILHRTGNNLPSMTTTLECTLTSNLHLSAKITLGCWVSQRVSGHSYKRHCDSKTSTIYHPLFILVGVPPNRTPPVEGIHFLRKCQETLGTRFCCPKVWPNGYCLSILNVRLPAMECWDLLNWDYRVLLSHFLSSPVFFKPWVTSRQSFIKFPDNLFPL